VKAPYPTTAVLAAMLRADDNKAVRYVVAVLKSNRGNMRETARELGCSERTLYNWRDANKRLTKAFAQHAMGREGAGPNATREREKAGK
jgi:transposase-like protein